MQASFSFPPPVAQSPAAAKAVYGHRISATPRRPTFAEPALVTTTHPTTGTMRPMYHIPPLAQQYRPHASFSGPSPAAGVALRSQSFQAGVGMMPLATPLRRMTKADFVAIMEEIYDALPDPHTPQGQLLHILQDVHATIVSESRAREDWQRKMEESLEHFKTSVSSEVLALEKQIRRTSGSGGQAPPKSADSGFDEDAAMDLADGSAGSQTKRPVSDLRSQ